MSACRACDRCLARTWLLGRLASRLERVRGRIEAVLRLSDQELVAAVGGSDRDRIARELGGVDVSECRRRVADAGLETICRCEPRYPSRLRALTSPPAVLHVSGGLERFLALAAQDPVAIVGSRRASAYGLEVARALGRELAAAGVTVLSGMALGVDSAAHVGALAAGGPTVAVLPGSADRPYPASKRALHRQISSQGAAISELAPPAAIWKWTFPARNRLIAGLAASTVVVEGGERSGALVTAGFARQLGRPVGAVPGRITAPQAAGPNGLLAAGAYVTRGAQDVLDELFGDGVRRAPVARRAELAPKLRELLSAIAAGHDTAAALAHAGVTAEDGLAVLASLELDGYVRRGAGGRFTVLP